MSLRNRTYYALFYLLLIVSISSSCAGLRHLPEGESLYTGMRLKVKKEKSLGKFKIQNAPVKLGIAYKNVWDVPNGGVFGTPFVRIWSTRLFLYNVFRTKKEKGFVFWMRNNFGEEPVLISKIQPEIKCQLLEKTYADRGHFGTEASYKLKTKRKGRKTKIKYFVKVHPSYHYNRISQLDVSENSLIDSVLREYRKESTVLKVGDEFSIFKLEEERQLAWEHLQNNGFYYVSPEDILFEADTSIGNRKIDLHLFINPDLSSKQLGKTVITDINVQLDSMNVDLSSNSDYFYYPKGKLNYKFLDKIITIDSNTYFSREKSLLAARLLNQTSIFGGYSIKYVSNPLDSSQLTANISLTAKKATQFGVRIDANYKSIGYIGPSIELNLKQLNIQGKGRNLKSKANFFYDEPIGIYRKRISSAYGIELNTTYSFLSMSDRFKVNEKEGYLPYYQLNSNVQLINRLDFYTQVSISGSYSLLWTPNQSTAHRIDIVNLSLFDLLNTTERYDSIANQNPLIKTSLNNQLLLSSGYTYTKDKRINPRWPRGMFFEFKIETAGNLLNLVHQLISDQEKGNLSILGAKTVQFTQFQLDYRFFQALGPRNTLAFRFKSGFGLAYGNSISMPYSKQYYLGGASSLRPFTARALGPGLYLEFDEGEVNQVGDIDIEASFEYRFKLRPFISGAVWADCGNIWLLNEDPLRAGSGIQWNRFYKDVYLTAGIGLRVDLNFIMIRADLGTVLYLPILPEGYKWFYQFNVPLFGPSIGFGFPF